VDPLVSTISPDRFDFWNTFNLTFDFEFYKKILKTVVVFGFCFVV